MYDVITGVDGSGNLLRATSTVGRCSLGPYHRHRHYRHSWANGSNIKGSITIAPGATGTAATYTFQGQLTQ